MKRTKYNPDQQAFMKDNAAKMYELMVDLRNTTSNQTARREQLVWKIDVMIDEIENSRQGEGGQK